MEASLRLSTMSSSTANTLGNSYVVLRYSFDQIRGIDRDADWFSTFSSATAALDDLTTATDEKERAKIFASALSLYKQGLS